MPKSNANPNIVIYQTKTGSIEFKEDLKSETIWATQAQIVTLFNVDQSVVARHIKNIFQDGEVDQKSNMQKMHIANSDKPVAFYYLDVILAVGYRTNSSRAIAFRQWTTKTLRQHILEGYTVNKKRLAKNYDAFLQALEIVKKLLPAQGAVDTGSVLELIKVFASTWFSLDAYDRASFSAQDLTKKQVRITAEGLEKALESLKAELGLKNSVGEFFAREKSLGVLSGIVGNIFQSYGDQDLYATVEEKAAHLLYFIVKNHPFVDGNKRSGAFAFVWFLKRAGILDTKKMTPEVLTALTLLIAGSQPSDKTRMVGLVLLLLNKKSLTK